MTPVTRRFPDRRLAKLLRQPGGRTVAEIEADVTSRLADLRTSSERSVRSILKRLLEAGEAPARPRTDDELSAIYRLANEAVGLSRVAECDDIGQACLCLCQIVDGFRNGVAWNGPAFEVILQSIALLSMSDAVLDAEVRQRAVAGLSQVVAKTLK